MGDPITIDPEQAASLAEHGMFVVGVDPAMRQVDLPQGIGYERQPPAVWSDLDRPCSTCDGEGFVPIGQYSSMGCPGGCFGSGQTVTELVTERYNFPRWSLGSFTVEVFPLDDKPLLSTDVEDGAIPAATLRSMGIDAKPGQYAIVATKVDSNAG